MAIRRPPKLDHVKYVLRRGTWYAYFNTGQKRDGKPIYAPLPRPGAPGFFDSYAARCAARSKRIEGAYTVAMLVAEYQRSTDFAEKAANTQMLYNNQALKIIDAWGQFPANNLDSASVRFVLDAGRWGAATRNMVIAVLGVVYTWGRRRGKVDISPARDLERGKVGEHEPWPEDIVEAALVDENATVRLAVHLLYFTGQRIGDVCAIRWGQIRGGVLNVTQAKTGKRLHIPILPELKAELDRTPKAGLTILHGITDRKLRRALKDFTASMGVETVPHGLRKNAVNTLLEAGCTIAEVAAITGQTYQVVEHYAARVNTRKLGQAAMLKFETARGTK